MAKKKKIVEILHMVCKETGNHNYTIRKKRGENKLELMKYCPALRKHTLHVEKRK
ncbi:50S ribosomal protein L33 [Planctomycetes bacterium Pan216]|uniref:Large ribosomal subunit protein bL33 n=1 Tax=Kolteria novifilia TaxID=2527975 RepID=A0A518AXM6_9BACT|nr:50S ribosomal protein L33 [Planctomycetes bacterium Pan216]